MHVGVHFPILCPITLPGFSKPKKQGESSQQMGVFVYTYSVEPSTVGTHG